MVTERGGKGYGRVRGSALAHAVGIAVKRLRPLARPEPRTLNPSLAFLVPLGGRLFFLQSMILVETHFRELVHLLAGGLDSQTIVLR